MSDLISRSEAIQRLINETEESKNNLIHINTVKRLLKDVDTVYSVDKVVEELEEVKMRYFLTIANTGDEKSDFAYENVGNALDEAIKIVKQGGVSDDVCEWEYNDSEYYFESSCNHLHIFMSDGPKENEYDFCPYCGKKINVVE